MIVHTCQHCQELFVLSASISRENVESKVKLSRHLIHVHEWVEDMDIHEIMCKVNKANHFDCSIVN